MQRRQILKTIPFLTALFASAAYAQNRLTDVEQLFDIAAAKHRQELRDLWRMRAAPLISLHDVSSRSIASVLAVTKERQEQWRRYQEITYLPKTAVLFYSYDEGSLQAWLVSATGMQAYHKQSISKQQISEAIATLRDSLNIGSSQNSRIPQQRTKIGMVQSTGRARISRDCAIANLTQILIPTPIATKLVSIEHLVIVPVLEIGTVPYAILRPFRETSFLIDNMSISIASSLFDLGQALYGKGAEHFLSDPLIVGNPYLPDSADWAVPPLPGAEQEARAVAKMMKANPLIGKEATKAEILARVEKSSLLYFATHGIASSQNPLSEGFLMFSAAQFEQGWWTAREIQNAKLSAEMAVLSACQTGLGQTHDAGIIGLSRAFQIAGVPRVVMSLWNVDDEATSNLMKEFVQHLTTHIPSEALRQAMLKVREEYPDPSKWASFVMFGTPR